MHNQSVHDFWFPIPQKLLILLIYLKIDLMSYLCTKANSYKNKKTKSKYAFDFLVLLQSKNKHCDYLYMK